MSRGVNRCRRWTALRCSPLLHQDVVTSVLIGAKSMEQLEDNLKAIDIELSGNKLQQLEKVSMLPLEDPQWMISRQASDRRPGDESAQC
jgi:hypothetical protein